MVITLRPNRSATWEETRLLIGLICGTTMAIGVFWAVAGAWAVLPFSGIEAILVACLLYRVSRQTYQYQRIIFDQDSVQVQFGLTFPRRRYRMNRPDTGLAVIEPAHPLDPLELSIFDRQYHVELGRFLNKEDREKALAELKSAGLYVRSYNPLGVGSF